MSRDSVVVECRVFELLRCLLTRFTVYSLQITHPDILEYLAQICSFVVKREYVKV